jgi:ketosteroid isomerase-like protein
MGVSRGLKGELDGMAEAENKQVVEKLVQAINTWDLESWTSCHTEDVTSLSMLSGGISIGIASRRQALLDWQQRFAVLRNDIVGLYPSGDHVILEVSVYFKLAMEYKGNPPGFERTRYEIFVYKFRDGKICEARSYN